MKNHRLFRLSALGLSCLAILAVDFSVRHLYLLFHQPDHGRTANPYFDHGYRPNMAWTDRYSGETPFFSNSLAFRDGKIRDVPLVSSQPRILLMGDSFTEGVGVPWADTFAGRLQAALGPQGIEVLNAGVGSYTPVLEKIKLRYLIENVGLRFDYLVLLLDLSDIRDQLFYRETAEGRAELIPYGPFASQAGWGHGVEKMADFVETRLEPHFVLLGAVARNLKLVVLNVTRKELGKRGAHTYLPDFIQYWDQDRAPQKEIAEAGIRSLRESLGGINQLMQRHGIPWMLVIYPWPSYRASPGQTTQMQRIWREWARENKVAFLDLFPVFASLGDFDSHYIPGDCHWNAQGHGLVAQVLEGELKQRNKLPR
jgi:hypothetical protein